MSDLSLSFLSHGLVGATIFLMLLKARVQFEFQFDLLFIVHCIGIFIHIWGHFVTIFRSHACEPLIDVIKLIRQINMISNKNSKRERNHCGSLLWITDFIIGRRPTRQRNLSVSTHYWLVGQNHCLLLSSLMASKVCHLFVAWHYEMTFWYPSILVHIYFWLEQIFTCCRCRWTISRTTRGQPWGARQTTPLST